MDERRLSKEDIQRVISNDQEHDSLLYEMWTKDREEMLPLIVIHEGGHHQLLVYDSVSSVEWKIPVADIIALLEDAMREIPEPTGMNDA